MQNQTIKYIIGIAIILLFMNCNSKKEEVRSMNDTGEDIEDLKERIRKKGDTLAYNYLQTEMLDIQNGNDTMYVYAKIMADKYHYLPACYDVYDCIKYEYDSLRNKWNRDNNDYLLSLNMDEDRRKEAFKYLLYGAEKGDKVSMWELGNYYKIGKFFPKDTIKAKKLQSK
jgi:hypothetical protein